MSKTKIKNHTSSPQVLYVTKGDPVGVPPFGVVEVSDFNKEHALNKTLLEMQVIGLDPDEVVSPAEPIAPETPKTHASRTKGDSA